MKKIMKKKPATKRVAKVEKVHVGLIPEDAKTAPSKVRNYIVSWRFRWVTQAAPFELTTVKATNVDRAMSKVRKDLIEEHGIRKPDVVVLSCVEDV